MLILTLSQPAKVWYRMPKKISKTVYVQEKIQQSDRL